MDSEFSIFTLSGPFIWPIIFLSLVLVVLVVERFLFLHRGQIQAHSFVKGIENLLLKGSLTEALTVCEDTPSAVSRVVRAALLQADKNEKELEQAIQKAAFLEIPLLERRLGSIGMIAKVSPLLGLLGTLTAVVEIFYQYSNGQNFQQSQIFYNLLYQAINSTIIGVAVAVVAYVAYYFLHSRVRALLFDLEWTSNEMYSILQKTKPSSAN